MFTTSITTLDTLGPIGEEKALFRSNRVKNRMPKFSCFCLILLLSFPAWADSPRQAVEQVLNGFHEAAAQADGERYFDYFAPDGVFLGTDITERWNVDQFKSYAMPYFRKGQGWTYTPQERHVTFSTDGNTAWFDETLKSENYGATRGSGVLVRLDGQWKVSQYHLTVPIPNALLERVVEMIESQSSGKN